MAAIPSTLQGTTGLSYDARSLDGLRGKAASDPRGEGRAEVWTPAAK